MEAGSPGKSLELELRVGLREVKRRAGRKEAGAGMPQGKGRGREVFRPRPKALARGLGDSGATLR